MKKLWLSIAILGALVLSLTHIPTVNVEASPVNVLNSANVHNLPKNDARMSNNMSRQQLLSEITRQYKYSYPTFKGEVKAYTPSQYRELKAGKSVQGITPEYLDKLPTRLSAINQVLKITGTIFPVANPNIAPFSSVGVISAWTSLANGVMIINSPYLSDFLKSDGSHSMNTAGGTGFSIGVNRIGTAAHMLYEEGHYISGAIINFGDSRPNHQGVGYGTLTRLMVPQSWINNSSATSNDYAAAIVSMNSGSMPAAFNLNTNPPNDTSAVSIGFPGDPQAGFVTQGVMIESRGTVTPWYKDPMGIYVSQDVSSYHGMSGGPLLDVNNTVIGINILAFHDDSGTENQWGFRRMNAGVAGFMLNS